jgi:hypothetical protein
MSTTATIVTTAIVADKILEAANLALSISIQLQQRSAEIAKAHAEGRTLTDEELQQHLTATQAAIDALKGTQP